LLVLRAGKYFLSKNCKQVGEKKLAKLMKINPKQTTSHQPSNSMFKNTHSQKREREENTPPPPNRLFDFNSSHTQQNKKNFYFE
jgi:hypothetical protein